MSGGRRIWTVAEANARVAGLTMIIGGQLSRAAEIERRWKRLLAEMGPERADFSRIVAPRAEAKGAPGITSVSPESELRDLVSEYEEGWRSIEADGIYVKDFRIGLCDFFGKIDGASVWLCWRYGEAAVDYYHGLDAGFAGRKPLSPGARQKLLN